MKRWWCVAGAVLAVGLVVGDLVSVAQAGQSPSVGLAPHRALYTATLATSRPGSNIANASGTMSYEFADACDGWLVESRIAIHYAYTEGGESDITTDMLSWESKDGLRYRFRQRSTRDGQITEETEGTAKLRGKGQGGVAHFTRPEAQTMPLPKGVLFPTEHSRALLDAALAGRPTLARVVFDGSDAEGAYDVNAAIGGPRMQDNPGQLPLLDVQAWPMRLAFFPLDGDEPTPDFELAMDYHVNGVSRSVIQAFKTFSLNFRLAKIEPLPLAPHKKGC